jgi:hypothetical protein
MMRRLRTIGGARGPAWLALFALILHALWPLASAALPTADPAAAGICSASGFRLIQPSDDGGTTQPLHAKLQCLQCGWCASPVGHGATAQTGFAIASIDADFTLAPARTAASVPAGNHWVPWARPRAPPCSSPESDHG